MEGKYNTLSSQPFYKFFSTSFSFVQTIPTNVEAIPDPVSFRVGRCRANPGSTWIHAKQSERNGRKKGARRKKSRFESRAERKGCVLHERQRRRNNWNLIYVQRAKNVPPLACELAMRTLSRECMLEYLDNFFLSFPRSRCEFANNFFFYHRPLCAPSSSFFQAYVHVMN